MVQRAPSRVAEKRHHFLVSVEGVTTLLGIPASILKGSARDVARPPRSSPSHRVALGDVRVGVLIAVFDPMPPSLGGAMRGGPPRPPVARSDIPSYEESGAPGAEPVAGNEPGWEGLIMTS